MDIFTYAALKKEIKNTSSDINIPSNLSDLSEDSTHRTVTDLEKESWNAKSDFSGDFNDLINKPTYTANDIGADLKGSADKAEENAKKYADDRFTELIGTSPENLDTIYELADAVTNNQTAVDAIEASITNKVNKVDGKDLSTNDLTDELKSVYDNAAIHANGEHAPSSAQENVIESISINGITQTISDKNVDLPLSSPVIKCTASGNPITITDSANMPINSFNIYGRSTQQTTTGAQLLDTSKFNNMTISGITFAKNTDGSIKVSGTATASAMTNFIYINLTAGTYSISGGTKVWCYIIKSDGTKNYYYNKSFTVDGTEKSVGIYIQIPANETINTTVYPMLNAGNTALPWESYTGGKASPSPDYPQNIVSIGDNETVGVTVTGAQLLDISGATDKTNTAGMKLIINGDGSYTITGTAGDAAGNLWLGGNYFTEADNPPVLFTLPAGTYTVNGAVLFSYTKAFGGAFIGNAATFILTDDTVITGVRNPSLKVGTTYNDRIYPMLNAGSTLLPWEPYTGQFIALTTPNGMCGIPVSSGGNYTDENGQQWICDTVKLRSDGTGKRVQRIGKVDNTKWELSNVASGTTGTRFMNILNGAQAVQDVANTPVICTHYKQSIASFTKEGDFISTGEVPVDGRIHIRTTRENITEEEFIAWTKEVGMKTYYILAEPIETDISTKELAVFKALHTNYPTTTIITGENAYMEIEYVADTRNYISRENTLLADIFNQHITEIEKLRADVDYLLMLEEG